MDLLDRLLGHDAWTTRRLLEQSAPLGDAQLDQVFGLGHRTVRATFDHLIDNMETWVALMNGVPVRPLPEPQAQWQTLKGLTARLDVVAPQLAELARRVQASDQWDALWTDVLDEPPTRKTYGGAIAHVITHSMHHRAQLIYFLRQLGIEDVIEGDVLGWESQASGELRSTG